MNKVKETACTIAGIINGFLSLVMLIGIIKTENPAAVLGYSFFWLLFLLIAIYFFRKINLNIINIIFNYNVINTFILRKLF